jgi:hypothetical protein
MSRDRDDRRETPACALQAPLAGTQAGATAVVSASLTQQGVLSSSLCSTVAASHERSLSSWCGATEELVLDHI